MQTAVFVGLASFHNYKLFYLLIFVLGNAVIIRYLIVYAHLMEFVASKHNLITGIFLFLDGLVYIYSPLILIYFTKWTVYFSYMALGFSVAAIVLLAFFFHMPESLKFAMATDDISKFQSDMEYICGLNGCPEQADRINSLLERYCAQVNAEAKTVGVEVGKAGLLRQVLNDKNVMRNLGLMVVCWVSTTFMYYLVIFFVKYLPGNIYTNQVVSGLSAFSYLAAPFMARRYDNKRIMLIGYVVSLVFLVIMIVFQSVAINEVLYSFIFFLFKCGVTLVWLSLLVIHMDMFDTQFIASSYGICNIISRLLTLGAPIVAEMEERIWPLLIMLILNVMALVATWFLKPQKPLCE